MWGLKRSLRTAPISTVVVLSWMVLRLSESVAVGGLGSAVLELLSMPAALVVYAHLVVTAPFRGGPSMGVWFDRGLLFVIPVALDILLAVMRWGADRVYSRTYRRLDRCVDGASTRRSRAGIG